MKKIVLIILSAFVFSFYASSIYSFSIQDEIRLGRKFKKFMSTHFSYVKDPYINEYVKRVLKRITSHIPDLPFSIKLYIIVDPTVNAFAAPAGYVFVNTGLIINMDNEDELAAILAHELAHVRQRHLAKNIERSKYLTAVGLTGILAGILVGNPELAKAISISSIAGVQTAALRYSRENERDADKLGLEFLIRAGYSPYGMVRSFEKIKQLMKLSGVSTPPPYMLTHPGLVERIGYIKEMISYLSKHRKFKDVKNTDVSYLKIKVLTEARYGKNPHAVLQHIEYEENIKKLDFCILQLGKLIFYVRTSQFDMAKKIASSKCVNFEDPLWNRELGIYFFSIKEFDRSEFYLSKALHKKPNDIIAMLYLAKTLQYKGDLDLSISYLKKILVLDPLNREAHLLLGQAFGQKRDLFKAYLHLAYYYLYKGNKNKSLFYFNKAQSIAKSIEEKFQLKKFKRKIKEIF